MKIFWSWQSDTPGRIGRHFVRDALKNAVSKLAQAEDVEEPSEREAKDALHIDSDRQGVPGSPDLARTIFKKIEEAAVFVADVTLTGTQAEPQNDQPKRYINSNVAIEYGHAHHCLTDERILMIQNTHYGDRAMLPFDLRHKAGPLEFCLAPDASAAETKAAQEQLRDRLVVALRPYLKMHGLPATFGEMPVVDNRAVYFAQGDILASAGFADDMHRYAFATHRAFYLRLIPTRALPKVLSLVSLRELTDQRQLDVLTRRAVGAPLPSLNKFGATAYEFVSPDSSALRAASQAFQNGELWAVSNEFFVERKDGNYIPVTNVENIFKRVASNFFKVAEMIGIAPPYTMECGAVGLQNFTLGVGHYDAYGPIHSNEARVRRIISDLASTDTLIEDFLDELFDLTGNDRSKIRPESLPRR